jgi:hypothetical protein
MAYIFSKFLTKDSFDTFLDNHWSVAVPPYM